jgi:hypothetical protein
MHRPHRVVDVADHLPMVRPWNRGFGSSRRGPSVALLLLAGLAVYAFVHLMAAAYRPNRSRSRAIMIGTLLFAVGAIIMSLRRSAPRHRW